MDITPLINIDQQVIQSYGEGRFRVSGVVYAHPLIVLPTECSAWDVANDMDILKLEDFDLLAERAVALDVILFGSGKTGRRPDAALRQALKAKGMNIEFMDTGGACRTYNVLMAEGRRVGAALLPI